ncbi:putative FMN-dependent luciferase-like monooxygenase [Brevibacterium samyangense]|uniref:FMN-dependent luciferase-like monooxygenase n=1 Tax=Brevibacterium samyangense TaxID=366888 RepID=A0ABP5EJZ0_9MICO
MRIGFFTRLLEDAPAPDRYRFALDQIARAEDLGFDSAWVAQHHFSGAEGGLPSPLVFLSHAAARTRSIRLGTGIITLPMENPVRLAEDAAVLDVLSGGRLEIGVGSGGNPQSFPAFGTTFEERHPRFDENLRVLRTLFDGHELGTGHRLYPAVSGPTAAEAGGTSSSPASALSARIWQATFSAPGAEKAGAAGDGLMLSRTQPRPDEVASAEALRSGAPGFSLSDIQQPVVDAYTRALPAGATPRILASRTAFAVDPRDRAEVLGRTAAVLRGVAPRLFGFEADELSDEELLLASDTYFGTPDEILERMAQDAILGQATEVSFQVHSVPATHEETLRSLELLGTEVVPVLRSEFTASPVAS